MDLNSIVFTVLFFFLGGLVLVFFVSFLAYKVRNKQTTYKYHPDNYQTQEFLQPRTESIPIQYYNVPQYQPQQFQYRSSQQPVQNYRRRVNIYQVYN